MTYLISKGGMFVLALIDYIPCFLRDIDEFTALFSALDIEISNAGDFLKKLMDGQFIFYCDEEYLSVFEKALGIESYKDSEEKRRKKIILKFNEKLPYTVFRLKESLSAICGKENYSLFFIYDEYRLVLRILNEDDDVLRQCGELLERMVPANIKTDTVIFNTHEIVGKFKHSYLSQYTHWEIYSKIL